MLFSRQKRQTTSNNYTLEILFVVDPVVLNWFKRQIGTGTEEQIREQTFNVTRLHYLRVFNGINIRFTNSPELDVKLELVDIIFTKNLSFPVPIPFTPDSRSLIPAPGVLDDFRDWINTTQLPDHDHALFFTGYNLTYGGSTSSTGLSYPDSVCTVQAVSVVEEFYDERTAVYAAQELGRSLGSRLDMDGNFCRSTSLNIMSTKFVFNSPKTSNLWKFSRCSIAYIKAFLRKLDSDGKDCVRTRMNKAIPTQVPPTPDPDAQCRTAFGLNSFLCRAVTGTDYGALCGGMPCFVPKSTTCSNILPLDGTVCGNYSICQEGECVASSDGRNVPESCPFGDQPVLPASAGCSDRIYGRPFDCYLPSFNAACCQTCEEIKTDIGDCEYGDRIDRCQYSKCSTYNNFTRENLCCLTCKNGTSLIRTTTPASSSTTESTPATQSSTKTVSKSTKPTTPSDYDTTSESSPAVTTALVSKITSSFTTDETTSTLDVSFTSANTFPSSSADSTLTSSADSTSTQTTDKTSTDSFSTLTSMTDSTYTLTSSTDKTSSLASSTDSSSSLSPSTDSTLTSSADSTYTLTSSPDSSISLTSLTEGSSTLSSTTDTLTSSADKTLPSTETDVLSSTSTKTTISETTRTTTSQYTSSTTFPSSSDVTTTTPTTTSSSSGSSEEETSDESSSADSSEKKRRKIWEKKLKEQEKERKRREKRMKELKKNYEKLLKRLRKYMMSLNFRRFWSYYYIPRYMRS